MTDRRKAIAAADKAFSKWVRSRGHCERCGKTTGPFQCAHIIGRGKLSTRVDERNAWCLCPECHLELDTHPDDKRKFAVEKLSPEGYLHLRRAADNVRLWNLSASEWRAWAKHYNDRLKDSTP